MNLLELAGQQIGRLTVISRGATDHYPNGRAFTTWVCKCACGGHKTAATASLRSGRSNSCGCLAIEVSTRANKARATHNLSNTPEYAAVKGAISRCTEGSSDAANYFDRGIRVAPEWLGREGAIRFLNHIGTRPSSAHSLDRIDNDGNYEPGNVRWATRRMQSMNRSRVSKISDHALLRECKRRNLL